VLASFLPILEVLAVTDYSAVFEHYDRIENVWVALAFNLPHSGCGCAWFYLFDNARCRYYLAFGVSWVYFRHLLLSNSLAQSEHKRSLPFILDCETSLFPM
jgi:hypothetical protein